MTRGDIVLQRRVLQARCEGLSGRGVLKHASLCGRFTLHGSLFLLPSTTSSRFKCSLAVHSCSISFIVWLETISPDPLRETPGPEPQELGKWDAGTTHTLSKEKAKVKAVSVFPKRMTREGMVALAAPELPAVAQVAAGALLAEAPRHCCPAARESKQKPSLAPPCQI